MPESTQTEEVEVKPEGDVQSEERGESGKEAPERTESQPQEPSQGDTQQQINQIKRSLDKQISDGNKAIKTLQTQLEERNEELEIYKLHSDDPDKLQEELVERKTKRAVAQREQDMTHRELSLEARELSMTYGVPLSILEGADTVDKIKVLALEWRLNKSNGGTQLQEEPVPPVPLGNPGGFDSSMVAARQFLSENDVRDAYIKGQIDQDSRNREMKRLGVSGY